MPGPDSPELHAHKGTKSDMLATFGSHIHFVSVCITYTLTHAVSQSTVDPSAGGGHTRPRVPATPSPTSSPGQVGNTYVESQQSPI